MINRTTLDHPRARRSLECLVYDVTANELCGNIFEHDGAKEMLEWPAGNLGIIRAVALKQVPGLLV